MSVIICAALLAAARWQDPQVNSVNREPARAYSMPLASVSDAFTGELEPETPFRLSLNGVWKFHWTGALAQRPRDFFRTDYDDAEWTTIDVPSCVELRGWGAANYTNSEYPFPAKPPVVPEDPNYVSSYRTTFAVPAAWKDRDVFLRFDGVGAAATVWVNGREVGYTEDSYLPAEFDVTPYLDASRPEQLLAVEVFQRADGTYLEDQDYFRFSGIMRDVSLFAAPKRRLADFSFATVPDAAYRDWTLSLAAETKPAGMPVKASLYDAEHKLVGTFADRLVVPNARAWSAEDPYLYTLVLEAGDDVRATRLGFRETKIDGNVLKINGRAVKFHGVNRHESDPENGRSISVETMKCDVLLMKASNIDTVRTSHYPDHHSFYDLCDKYGIYLVAEANVEAHGMGYKEKGLGRDPAWEKAIVERNVNHVKNYRHHPSVAMWSLGNETGHGTNFIKAAAAVHALDSRPVHWERGNRDADIDSRMYPKVEWLEARGELGMARRDDMPPRYPGDESDQTKGKCFFLCEYAHAMGNAIGNFEEYWEVFYRYPCLAGGCIWDWVDQAVWKSDGRGGRFLAFGGDFDDQPNMGPFCVNGVVDPFRHVSPKLREVAHVHRPLRVTAADAATGKARLRNLQAFLPSSVYTMGWELVEDGVVRASGTVDAPDVAPGAEAEIVLPLPAGFAPRAGVECFYNVSFALKADTVWGKAGHVVARDQLPFGKPAERSDAVAPGAYAVTEDERSVIVRGEGLEAAFCRKTGTLYRLVLNGASVLEGPEAGPRFTCVRAFTDNDIQMRKQFYQKGLTQLKYTARPMKVVRGNDGSLAVKTRVDITSGKSAGFRHAADFVFGAGGVIRVDNTVEPYGDQPPTLPRMGVSLRINKAFSGLTWYGRGPWENYVDRCTAAFVGLWKSSVPDQYVDYVRPQDCGSKTGVRWLELTDTHAAGLRVESATPFVFSALEYDWEDLEFARHRHGDERRRIPLVPRDTVMLNVDCAQTGLGGGSCGPGPMDKYRVLPERRSWSYVLKAVASTDSFGSTAVDTHGAKD